MIQAEGVKYHLDIDGKGFQSGINNAVSGVSRLEGALSGLGSLIGVTFGLATVTAFASKMLDAGTTVENARIGLKTLMGSASEASGVIKNTLEDATKTPFAFEGLLMANKALISAGADAKTAREDVLNLANAIAATGGGDDELQRMVINLQQIKNTGRATAIDIRQFAYAGVNLYAALDAAGIKHAHDSELTYEQVTNALKVAHAEGGIYYKGLENMQGSVSVSLSNLKDSVFRLAVDAFDALRPAIVSVTGALQSMLTFVEQHESAVFAFATVIGVAIGAVALLTAGTWAWAAATTVATGGINLVIVGLAALAGALAVAWKESMTFRGVITGLWGVLKEFGSTTANIFGGLAKQIKGIFTFNPSEVVQGFDQMTTAMFGAGERMKSAYNSGFQSVVDDDKEETKALIEDRKKETLLKGMKKVGRKSTTAPAIGSASSSPLKRQTRTEAQGSKVVTINVSIGNLVKDFSIHTTNVREGVNKLQELVTNALKGSLNDSQLAIGQ